MSRRKRGRITVQDQPTGPAKVVERLSGAFCAVIGIVFVVLAVTEIIPSTGLFGVPFLAGGLFFGIIGGMMALGVNGLPQRMAYDIETDVEEETIAGLFEDVDRAVPAEKSHDHIPSTALSPKARLEQLETLREAGLLTREEYEEKRKEILREL